MLINYDTLNPVFVDFETQSAADLKKVGGRLYSQHRTTRILALVVDIDGIIYVWLPTVTPINTNTIPSLEGYDAGVNVIIRTGVELPSEIASVVASGRTLVAHNAFNFDAFIWEQFLPEHPVHGGWADTLPLARSLGLPGSLDSLSRQGGGTGKDTAKRLVAPLWRVSERSDGQVIYPPVLPGLVGPLVRYALGDVLLLRELWENDLAESVVESDVIKVTQVMNDRGCLLDTHLADIINAISVESSVQAGNQVRELTGGEIDNLKSQKQVTTWLAKNGLHVRDYALKETLRKDAIERALNDPSTMYDSDSPFEADEDLKPIVMKVLELRSAANRISGSKTETALRRCSPDGRMRDLQVYHRVHTGRFAGVGIKHDNLPRLKKEVPLQSLLSQAPQWNSCDALKLYDTISSQLPKHLSVDDALSGLIRPCFIPKPGHVFVIVDYAAIEARWIAWIADQESLLDMFRRGNDVYLSFGSKLFGRELVRPADDDKRQVSKTIILGSGYQMSAAKLGIYCQSARVDLASVGLTPAQCTEAYRSAYPRIAGIPSGNIAGVTYRRNGVWDKLNDAAMNAITEGGVHVAGKCKFTFDGQRLKCQLPSGRVISYQGAKVEDRIPAYFKNFKCDPRAKPTIVFQHPQGYETTTYGGKLSENVCQAGGRDMMVTAVIQAEQEGIPVVFTVHDEIVAEVPERDGEAVLKQLCEIMVRIPSWAPGFPLEVEGYVADRYLKSPPPGFPKLLLRSH